VASPPEPPASVAVWLDEELPHAPAHDSPTTAIAPPRTLDPLLRVQCMRAVYTPIGHAAFAGMKLMARSAIAVMVSDGLTPGFAETAAPSTT